MSKESRRAARLARESRRATGTGRPTSDDAAVRPAGASPAPTTGSGMRRGSSGGVRSAAAPPTRAGRRERVRHTREPSFFERYRTAIVTLVGVAIVGVVAAFVFLGSTGPVYACSTIFNPSPTPTVSPGSSERLGFVEDYMGNTHQAGPPFTYTYCPPASGNHYNAAGLGPIAPRVYKPDDKVAPPELGPQPGARRARRALQGR